MNEILHEFAAQSPSGWTPTRIGDALLEVDRPIEMDDSVFYRLASIRRRNGGMFHRETLPGRKILTKTLREVVPGSFVIARMQAVHGACTLVSDEFAGYAVSKSYSSFVGRPNCDIRFFSHLAKQPFMRRYFLSASHGVVIEKMTFDQGRWVSFPVYLPPLDEQRRIAEILDTIDEAIRANERLVAKRKQLRSGLLAKVVPCPDPTEKNAPIVANAGEVVLGRQRSPRHTRGLNPTPYLRVANVYLDSFDFSDVLRMDFTPQERDKYFVRTGDILLNEGQSLELVGRSAVYRGPDRTYCFQNTLARFRANQGRVLPEYAQLIFEQWLALGRFRQVARQTTSIAHLGADRFASMSMRLPDIPAQAAAVARMGAVDGQIGVESQRQTKLVMLRQALSADLLSGRVRSVAS